MMNFLLIIVLVIAVVTIAQVLRLMELSSKIGGEDVNDVTDKDNNKQGRNLLIFGILFILAFFYQTYRWGGLALPEAASEHGVGYDNLMNVTMGIIIFVFLVTMPLLFWFSYKYRGVNGRKAVFFSHNNKLELIWTVIPAIALTVLITYGMSLWNDIMFPENPKDSLQVEVYAKQFDWTVRYSGEDNKLGKANVRYVGGQNITGVISKSTSHARIAELSDEIKTLKTKVATNKNAIKVRKAEDDIKSISKKIDVVKAIELQTTIDDLKAAEDDIVVKELHLPIGKQVQLNFRSQDIIHSAYLPHFRVQMNCVPGANTSFTFVPTKTTEEMRTITENSEFDYVLMCNKICGAAHYNMQLKVVVESEEDYKKWLSEQKTLTASL
ncbi:MAG: cytochrome c oxidase subunit II transmembrane domain-containing protein [Flavobacteriales bacterium]